MSGPYPKCEECRKGVLLPLSDFHHQGASIPYKAWACSNHQCGFVMVIDKGDIQWRDKSKVLAVNTRGNHRS